MKFRLRDYSNLPKEILELILQLLISDFVNIIRFRSVCKSWRFISLKKPLNPPSQLPWLMLSSHTSLQNFFSLSENRLYSLPLQESWLSTCSGSSYGWLFIEECFSVCSLLNPVTRTRIYLPLMKLFFDSESPLFNLHLRMGGQERLVVKSALSSSPSYHGNSKNCFVMSILCVKDLSLVFCKLGVNLWIPVKSNGDVQFEDVIFFKRNFYVIDCYGAVYVCDLDCRSPVVNEIRRGDHSKAYKTYLVELSGKLTAIRRGRALRVGSKRSYRTILFQVLQQDSESGNWEEIKTLGNHAVFVGHNQSLSILASEFPGCKGNCIYFTDDCGKEYELGKGEPHDVGIYNLADGSIEHLPGYSVDPESVKQPPVWIAASPW